ncbi:hypothetical protein ACE6H2_001490 [Prunus campanulata]
MYASNHSAFCRQILTSVTSHLPSCIKCLFLASGFAAINRGTTSLNLYCDNQSAFEIANNPVQHDRTKYVEVDWHFIKEKLEHKLISIAFVPSSEQLADMLTHAVFNSLSWHGSTYLQA